MKLTAVSRGARLPRLAAILVAALALGAAAAFPSQPAASSQPASSSQPAASSQSAAESTAPRAAAAANVSAAATSKAPSMPWEEARWAFITLAVGLVVVLGLIIVGKVNAFLALIAAALAVSLMTAGPWASYEELKPQPDGTTKKVAHEGRVARVATEFGVAVGKIGVVIAAASIIGQCMLDSGAADRIVRFFLRLFGDGMAPAALTVSGYVLGIPVFFDTVFYLLVPLARSLFQKTKKNYLLYLLAISAGGAITHTLVPPTPGPLAMAATLNVSIGLAILMGIVVAAPAALAALFFAYVANARMPLEPIRAPGEPEAKIATNAELPPLWLSLAPIALPVLLISGATVFEMLVKSQAASAQPGPAWLAAANNVFGVLGNANFALLLASVVAMLMVAWKKNLSRVEIASLVETSLFAGGLIILITAAGGAFGAMLKTARLGDAIQSLFAGGAVSGLTILFVGFSVAALMKVAQGSSTVAMITVSGMFVSLGTREALGFHPVYLALAIGSGSLVGSWMNDSGFWVFAKMGGVSEMNSLRSWTLLLLVLAFTGLGVTVLLALTLPL